MCLILFIQQDSLQGEQAETPGPEGHHGNQRPFFSLVVHNDHCGIQGIKVVVKEEEEEGVKGKVR